MGRITQPTQAQMEKMVIFVWGRFAKYEKIVRFDGDRIIKGELAYAAYLRLREEVEAWLPHFHYLNLRLP